MICKLNLSKVSPNYSCHINEVELKVQYYQYNEVEA